MRSVWVALLFLVVVQVTYAADTPIAGIDPLIYVSEGWYWGAFTDSESNISATNAGIALNIQPAAAGDYVGKTNGAIGMWFGGLQFDPAEYELEVKFRVLGENVADSFRVLLAEPGTPDTGDEFQYHFDSLMSYEENEWVTVTKALDSYNGIYSNQAEQVLDGVLGNFQLGTMWDSTSAPNIEVASALLKPVNATPDNVVAELNANNARRCWSWGAFSKAGAVVNDGNTIKIDLDEYADDGTTFGGLGTGWLGHDFDPETSELVVKVKLGENNTATRFHINLKDDDGLDGIESWDPRQLDQAAEEYQFPFLTEGLSAEEFTELRLPFYDEDGLPTWSYRGKPGEPLFDGDTEMNFGNYMFQIQSQWNNSDRLNIEIESIRIETAFSNPCDLNGDGDCNAVDIDALTVATLAGSQDPKYDLDGNGSLNFDDRKVMVDDLLYTYFGDANLDGQFSSADFVEVFSAGQYEDAVADNSGWATGDWDGDLDFTSADFVAAFAAGGYEMGPRAAVSAVPEPSSIVLVGLALLGLAARRRTSR